MNSTISKFYLLLMMFSGFSLLISCSASKKATDTSAKAVEMDPYVGTWDYIVSGTPQGDMKGELVIAKQEGTYGASMEGDAGSLEVSDLKIMENKLTGNFTIQGYDVDVSGTFEGQSFNGEVSVEYEAFPMIATKRNP